MKSSAMSHSTNHLLKAARTRTAAAATASTAVALHHTRVRELPASVLARSHGASHEAFLVDRFFGLDLHAVMHRCLRCQLHHSPPWEVLFRFLKTSTPCSGDCATTPQLLLPSVSLSLCTLLNTVGSLDPCAATLLSS